MMFAQNDANRRIIINSLMRYQELYANTTDLNATNREALIGHPEFRRLIYDRNLRVDPMNTQGRVRDCSARFLRRNEALLIRLEVWLRRELGVLLMVCDDNF